MPKTTIIYSRQNSLPSILFGLMTLPGLFSLRLQSIAGRMILSSIGIDLNFFLAVAHSWMATDIVRYGEESEYLVKHTNSGLYSVRWCAIFPPSRAAVKRQVSDNCSEL